LAKPQKQDAVCLDHSNAAHRSNICCRSQIPQGTSNQQGIQQQAAGHAALLLDNLYLNPRPDPEPSIDAFAGSCNICSSSWCWVLRSHGQATNSTADDLKTPTKHHDEYAYACMACIQWQPAAVNSTIIAG
jgi:hypothetical protein